MLYEINMYESRKEGYDEGKADGIAEGISRGKAEGLAEGKSIGRSEGIAEGKTELLNDLIKKFIISGKDTAEIMELLSVPEDRVSEIRRHLY